VKTTLRGIIRGKTIELEQEPGLPDGLAVAVAIQPLGEKEPALAPAPPAPAPWWLDRLDVDPGRAGRFVVKGTFLEAETLAAALEGGRDEEEVLRDYPELTPEDLAAVREYAKVPPGLRRSFGGWAEDTEDLDEYLDWNRRQRTSDRRGVEE
jgi:uncharacterized protein (DUF433 family)